MKQDRPSLTELFLKFSKIGVMTFGGGYAMLPMFIREIVNNSGWATEEEMLDCFAVAQCTPGVIAVNTATYIGFKKRGVIGGIVATLGVVFPSFLIITFLASILRMFKDNVYGLKAFAGIRVAVCALITSAVIKLAKKAINGFETATIAVLSLFVEIFLNINPSFIVISAIAYALILFFAKRKKEGR